MPILLSFSFIVLNGGDFGHMMDWDHHMMNWWGIPFSGYWTIIVWIILVIIGSLVYKDAENRKMNGLLWFILIILPWIGIVFLIVYLIIREEQVEMVSALKDAQKILDENYAKGEITRTEYLLAKKDIDIKTEEVKNP